MLLSVVMFSLILNLSIVFCLAWCFSSFKKNCDGCSFCSMCSILAHILVPSAWWAKYMSNSSLIVIISFENWVGFLLNSFNFCSKCLI